MEVSLTPAFTMLAGWRPMRASASHFESRPKAAGSSTFRSISENRMALAVPVSLAISGTRSRRRRGKTSVNQAQAQVEVEAPKVAQSKVDAVKSIISNVLDAKVPEKIEVFLNVLEGSGWEVLDKDGWKTLEGDMHPFILPLARRGDGEDLEVVGLLMREPNGKKFARPRDMMVASQKLVKGPFVELVAMDMEKYIERRAEEAFFEKEKKDLPVIEATKDVYDIQFKGTDRAALDKWLLIEVGAFPDVHRSLLDSKLAENDPTTALIIADTMREKYGTSWCFPHQAVSWTLRTFFNGENGTADRILEGRTTAQQCFTSGYPIWTLSPDFLAKEPLLEFLQSANVPKLPDLDTLRVFYLKRVTDDQRTAVRTGSISLGMAVLAKAQGLMDSVVVGHKSFNTIRDELAELYEEVPGCEDLCDAMRYFKQPEKKD
mmetsp:Transcript_89819/g.159759  ORF Transcript_89819/g.159759 Transcript_89819/m.159759 type:complete len:432 (+) Transcript_89819:60-1355(+)